MKWLELTQSADSKRIVVNPAHVIAVRAAPTAPGAVLVTSAMNPGQSGQVHQAPHPVEIYVRETLPVVMEQIYQL
jgi:quercetin dioxygenase-like cupin family protein